MSDKPERRDQRHTRRDFIASTAALAGAAAIAGPAAAQQPARRSKRGGTLRFGTRDDTIALDSHRQVQYFTSHPTAATTGGLLDFNGEMEPVAGIATEWDASADLKVWTFKLRRGAEFHNGESVDAAAVKWNFERILDPKIGHSFTRSALIDVERMDIDDKHTLRIHLKSPNAAFDTNVIYYPVNLLATGAIENVDQHPVGCGPFKFKSWKRYDTTELVRFDNFWETDAEGNTLPYLDALIGKPKKEDRVRLTALRAGEVDMIENMAYADAANFVNEHGARFNTYDVHQFGTAFIAFNLKNGPFSEKDNPDALLLRQAAAHAIDHRGIHEAVFHNRGEIAMGFFSRWSPWNTSDARSWPDYDPDKAKSLRKKAHQGDAKLVMIAPDAFPYMQQSAEVVHAMLVEAGFNVTMEIHPIPVIQDKQTKGTFDLDSSANSYRIDPDGWYSRSILSTAPDNRRRHGYANEKADRLILAAKVERDRQKRREMYRDVDSIVNQDLPILYTHYVPALAAASKKVQGYRPSFTGPFSYAGGGLRRTWIEG